MHCIPTSIGGNGNIIVIVDYFTKWDEAMPTYAEDDKTASLIFFNHVIARFGVPQAIITDHCSLSKNQMTSKLSVKPGFCHDNSTLYYPKANGQFEEINKV